MIFETLAHLDKNARIKANVASRTHAIGWTGLFNGFSSGEKADWTTMLPFPDAVEGAKKTESLSRSTIAAMKRAIESRKIKPQLLSAMMEVNEEIAKFAQATL